MMRKEFKFKILVWSLIWILGAIGLASCSDDDEDDGIYQGYITYVEFENNIGIKITKSPSNIGIDKPHTKDVLNVNSFNHADFPNIIFKENQKLIFTIISAEPGINFFDVYWRNWDNCKISILKVE